MLLIDMNNTGARLTVNEVLAAGRRWVSNPFAFAAFWAGLRPRAEILLDKRWTEPVGLSKRAMLSRYFLHEMLPNHYDVRHLEKLGGRFALRLTGVGDFTVTVVNRRVVTFTGLPAGDRPGHPFFDVEMGGDVFSALLNELIADVSRSTLLVIEPGDRSAAA